MSTGLEEVDSAHNHLRDAPAVTPTIATPALLKLPPEILAIILQSFVPPLSLRREDLKPHWHCSIPDTSALKSVSQTCHRLRDVARTLSLVVKTVIINDETPLDADMKNALVQDVPLNVYISFVHRTPEDVRDWYIREAYRIEELHLTRLGHMNMDLWVPLLTLATPKLRFLSITGAGVGWLPPTGSLLLLPQASQLRYLTLRKVCFLPRNHFPSLTHLALINVRVPRYDKTLLTFLGRCPKLESLVLLNSKESIMNRPAPTLKVHLPCLQRVTLEIPDEDGEAQVDLNTLVPHNRNMAFQLLSPNIKEEFATLIIPKFSPNPHTLRIVHLDHPSVAKDTFKPTPFRGTYDERGSASVTTVGPSGTFHMVECSNVSDISDITGPYYTAARTMLEDKSHLAEVRELWLVGTLAARPIKDSDSPTMTTHWRERIPWRESTYTHRVAIAVRDVILGLSAVEEVVYILPYTLEPNLWILPSTTHPAFASPNLKTLRLVICRGIDFHATNATATLRPELKLAKMCEGLATGNYAYIDTLVLQMARNIVIDETEMLQISKYVPTVKVERIHAVPEMSLPEYCREPFTQGCTREGALW